MDNKEGQYNKFPEAFLIVSACISGDGYLWKYQKGKYNRFPEAFHVMPGYSSDTIPPGRSALLAFRRLSGP
ncbi:hypothetical protein [Methanococcoides burtonii]|uniref:hypothetical protein n=1 Tax=Methanococcoides burtonii TaxID=29291 RepID=UPI000045E1AF|nr:hypothetical protein [Methanococcoides burtonii]